MAPRIYAFEHTASGKRYIGSAMNHKKRRLDHIHLLRKGKHHSRHLQSAWNKYGENAFEFRVLLVCAADLLLFYEQLCIDGYEASDRQYGFNAAPAAGSQLGYRHSEQTLALLRAGKRTPEARARARAGRLGIKESQETRALQSAMRRGVKLTFAARDARAPKLTFANAGEIRVKWLAGGQKHREIAAEYGVCRSTVSKIVAGVLWPDTR